LIENVVDNITDASKMNSKVLIIADASNMSNVIVEKINIVVITMSRPDIFVGGNISFSLEMRFPINITGCILSGTSPNIISIITEITIIDKM
jgi:hypothetical protein